MPGLLALIEGTLPSGRYRASELARSAPVIERRPSPRRSRRTSRPRPRRWPRRRARCSSRPRATAALAHARFAELPRLPRARATCSWSTRRRRCPPRSARAARRRRASCSTSRRPRRGDGALGRRAAHRDERRRSARRRLGARSSCPAARRAELLAPLPRQRAPVGRPARAAASRVAELPGRHGRPIRYGYVPQRAGRSTPTRPSSRSSPAAPRCRAPGRPFTPRAGHRARRPRRRSSRRSTLHTGVSSLERDEPPYPERYRVPGATARLVNAVHGGAAA